AEPFDKAALANGDHWVTLAAAGIERMGGRDLMRAHLSDAEGTLWASQARLDEAIGAFQRSIALQKASGNVSGLATTLNALGVVLGKQNKRDEARVVLEQAVATLEQTLGPMHPKTAVPGFVLAQLLKDSGPLDRAEAYARRALQSFEGALPPGHPRVGAALDTLGEVLLQEGKTDEALSTFRRALEHRRPNDYNQALDRIGIAIALDRQGKLDEAAATIE